MTNPPQVGHGPPTTLVTVQPDVTVWVRGVGLLGDSVGTPPFPGINDTLPPPLPLPGTRVTVPPPPLPLPGMRVTPRSAISGAATAVSAARGLTHTCREQLMAAVTVVYLLQAVVVLTGAAVVVAFLIVVDDEVLAGAAVARALTRLSVDHG